MEKRKKEQTITILLVLLALIINSVNLTKNYNQIYAEENEYASSALFFPLNIYSFGFKPAAMKDFATVNKDNPGYPAYLGGLNSLAVGIASLPVKGYLFLTNSPIEAYQKSSFIILFMSRVFSVICSALTILITRQISKNVGLRGYKKYISAVLLLFSYPFLTHSRIGKLEVSSCFLIVLFIYLCLKTLAVPSFKNYLLSAIILGAAIGTRATLGVFLVSFYLMHVFVCHHNKERISSYFIDKKLVISALALAAAFILLNPTLLISENKYKPSYSFYLAGTYGYEGGMFSNLVGLKNSIGIFALAVLMLAVFFLAAKPDKKAMLLLSPVVLFFILTVSWKIFSMRFIIPFLPIIYLILVLGLDRFFFEITGKRASVVDSHPVGNHPVRNIVFAVIVLALVLVNVSESIGYYYAVSQPTPGARLIGYIRETIPQNTSIGTYDLSGYTKNVVNTNKGIEGMWWASPYINRSEYTIQSYESYPEYVIFDSGRLDFFEASLEDGSITNHVWTGSTERLSPLSQPSTELILFYESVINGTNYEPVRSFGFEADNLFKEIAENTGSFDEFLFSHEKQLYRRKTNITNK